MQQGAIAETAGIAAGILLITSLVQIRNIQGYHGRWAHTWYGHAYKINNDAGSQIIAELAGDPNGWLPCTYTPTSEFSSVWAYPGTQIKARKALATRGVALVDPAYSTTGFFHLHCNHGMYNRTKLYDYAVAVAPFFKTRSDRITISWCGANEPRGSAAENHCYDMAQLVKTTLVTKTNISNTAIACWDDETTWKAWFSASVLVGTTGPFSFAVGIAMPSRYITPVYSANPETSTEWTQLPIPGLNPPANDSFYCG
jgi:hypothetical protein